MATPWPGRGVDSCWLGRSTHSMGASMIGPAILPRNARLPRPRRVACASKPSSISRSSSSAGSWSATRSSSMRSGSTGTTWPPRGSMPARFSSTAGWSGCSRRCHRLVQPRLQLRRPGHDRSGLLRAAAGARARLSLSSTGCGTIPTSRRSAAIRGSSACSGGSSSWSEPVRFGLPRTTSADPVRASARANRTASSTIQASGYPPAAPDLPQLSGMR